MNSFFHPENFHQSNPPLGKFPPGKFPSMFLNIPTRVFKFFVFSLLSPSSLILLNYLKHYLVILCFKAEVRNSEVDVSKKL